MRTAESPVALTPGPLAGGGVGGGGGWGVGLLSAHVPKLPKKPGNLCSS